MAAEPKAVRDRDDTAPYELKLTDVPIGRAPEREADSIGSQLYKVAAPLLGRNDAERVKQIANLIDGSAPVVAETIAQVWGHLSAQPSPTSGPTPSASMSSTSSPQATAAAAGRSSALAVTTIAIVILATTLGAVLIVAGVFAGMWARDLRSDVLDQSREQDAEIAAIRLESTRDTATAKGRQDAQDKQQEAMQKRLDLHDQQIQDTNDLVVTLTKHAVSRMDAIGKKTGADKLASWTETPASLLIVTLRDKAENDRKK